VTFWDFCHEHSIITFMAFVWGVAGVVDVVRYLTSGLRKGGDT
jgi:hypothetical protein